MRAATAFLDPTSWPRYPANLRNSVTVKTAQSTIPEGRRVVRPVSASTKSLGTYGVVFALVVFLSAFLLFSVQPLIAKYLLPAFGGTAGVWATCLAVFQILLLGGYAYAHLLCRTLTPGSQRIAHLVLLAVALAFLPAIPHVPSADKLIHVPVWQLIRSLVGSVGVPFFALSATAPLLMEWFRQSNPGRVPDRLYAFSNAGSLLALLLYPFVIEPALGRNAQSWCWAGGMALFFVLCGVTAWLTRQARTAALASRGPEAGSNPSPASADIAATPWLRHPHLALWILLPACGSALLLALTNQICQDVTPVPLLWLGPMAVYLLTFVLCFEGPRSYRRGLFLPLCLAALLLLAWFLYFGGMQALGVQIAVYLGILFIGCMSCHGELYRFRPNPEHLTAYYLCISIGGALGGSFVAIVAPLIFKGVYETPLVAIMLAAVISFILFRERSMIRWAKSRVSGGILAGIATLAIAAMLAWVIAQRQKQSIYSTRSFYGVYQVKEGPTWLINNVPFPLEHGPGRVLVSGQVYHGFQFLDPAAARFPTTYYSPESGLSVAFQELPKGTNRLIGAVGLGAGTLAAYTKSGDTVRLYELNPDVLDIAQRYFTFLKDAPAKFDFTLGDGRLSLQRDPPQNFDLLILDAFSGDSIPTHLLTDEAVRLYLRHLSANGVIAVHISNNHLDLEPVLRAVSEHNALQAVLVPPTDLNPSSGKLSSIWMLLTRNEDFLRRPAIAELLARSQRTDSGKRLLWTDDHYSILPILR